MAGQIYAPIGDVIKYTTENGPIHFPVAICETCGAVVSIEFHQAHDQFHEALADLWNQLLS